MVGQSADSERPSCACATRTRESAPAIVAFAASAFPMSSSSFGSLKRVHQRSTFAEPSAVSSAAVAERAVASPARSVAESSGGVKFAVGVGVTSVVWSGFGSGPILQPATATSAVKVRGRRGKRKSRGIGSAIEPRMILKLGTIPVFRGRIVQVRSRSPHRRPLFGKKFACDASRNEV